MRVVLAASGLYISEANWSKIQTRSEAQWAAGHAPRPLADVDSAAGGLVARPEQQQLVVPEVPDDDWLPAAADTMAATANLHGDVETLKLMVVGLQSKLQSSERQKRNLRQQVAYWKNDAQKRKARAAELVLASAVKKRKGVVFHVQGALKIAWKRQLGANVGAETVSILSDIESICGYRT